MGKAPIEIYSYFRRTGWLDVDRAIGKADPGEYAGYPYRRRGEEVRLCSPRMSGSARSFATWISVRR